MFVIEVPYFNLDQTYESCQCPRWIKLKDSKYVIPFRDKALKIEQQKDRFLMSCTEEDFYTTWFEYLDLRTDYFGENDKIKRLGGKFRIPANRGSGIHILNQDEFEAYILSKVVSNLGYWKAFHIMNHIAEACGISHIQSMREDGKITWYEFPDPAMILENFDRLRNMGKVNTWLEKLCIAILNDGFDYTDSDNELFRLFGLHDTSVFPLAGIEDAIGKNFKCDPSDFAARYLNSIENKGLVYAYIQHHVINPPKEKMLYGAR